MVESDLFRLLQMLCLASGLHHEGNVAIEQLTEVVI